MTITLDHRARNGVRLAFALAGAGPALLLIHGNACDHTYFAPQIEHFARTRTVLAVDLRGHGASDAPESGYGFAGWADDCAWLCQELDLTPAAVVGHSMGGMIAVEFADRHPELTAALAALDSSLLFDRQRQEVLLPPILAGLAGPHWREHLRAFFTPLFGPWLDPAEGERILARMASTPRHVLVANFRSLIGWDGRAALTALRRPFLYLAGGQGWRHPPAEIKAACPQAHTAQAALCGHFVTTEVPGQVNAMLERFLDLAGKPA